MRALVIGGTRFLGVELVRALLERGHEVTVATRGRTQDPFGDEVRRLRVDRSDRQEMREALRGERFDAVGDNIAYCSNDVAAALESIGEARYVLTSTASVYPELGMDTREEAFCPLRHPLVWCGRGDFPYGELKRQAEAALFQCYGERRGAAARFPYVIGEGDHTGRLRGYVLRAARGEAMTIDNPDARLGFITAREAGAFLASLLEEGRVGPVNAACEGTVSVREILGHVETRTGRAVVLRGDGEAGGFNGCDSFSLCTELAKSWGCIFSSARAGVYAVADGDLRKAGHG